MSHTRSVVSRGRLEINMDMSQLVRPRVISGKRVVAVMMGGFDLAFVGEGLATLV